MQVPNCSNPPGVTNSLVAFWAGLGGYGGLNGVIQDGFDYKNTGGLGTYTAWHEYADGPLIHNTSMWVAPNHSMTFWAWEGDASCVSGVGHTGYGCFWYKKHTTGTATTTLKEQEPPGSQFNGSSGEAIAERPGGWGPGSKPVSSFPFGSGVMTFYVVDSTGAWHSQASDPYTLLRIKNASGQTLVAAAALGSPDQVLTIWQRAQ